MSNQYLGQLSLVSFGFAPSGWALCNGQMLPINQNQALFSLIGVSFGGNGTTTFALPNLQGRTAISAGTGYTLGQTLGSETVALSAQQLPPHTHLLSVSSATGTLLPTVAGNTVGPGASPNLPYSGSANAVMDPGAISTAGASQPHENRSPFLVLNWIIALQGIYPSRS